MTERPPLNGTEIKFLGTRSRMEPRGDINAASDHEVLTSIAISLKRIADKLDGFDITPFGNQLLDIAYQAGVNFRGQP